MPQFQEPRSTPIARPVASTPVKRPSDCTIDRGRFPGLHLRAQARIAPRCRYNSTTSQAVNRGSWEVGQKEFVDDTCARDAYRTLLFARLGWVATTTRQGTASGPTGTCGQRSRLRTSLSLRALLELIGGQMQTCLNQWVIEHAVLFAAGNIREPSHIGEHGSRAILPKDMQEGARSFELLCASRYRPMAASPLRSSSR